MKDGQLALSAALGLQAPITGLTLLDWTCPSILSPASTSLTISESGICPAALQLAPPLGHADVLRGLSTQQAVDLTSGH